MLVPVTVLNPYSMGPDHSLVAGISGADICMVDTILAVIKAIKDIGGIEDTVAHTEAAVIIKVMVVGIEVADTEAAIINHNHALL